MASYAPSFSVLDDIRRQQLMRQLAQIQADPRGDLSLQTEQPSTYIEPESISAYRKLLQSSPNIEDYKPSRLRSIISGVAGVGAGLSTGNPEAAQSVSNNLRYSPYFRDMGVFQQKLARSKSLVDLDTELAKQRSDYEYNQARGAAERARESSERAQATQAERLAEKAAHETKILPPDYETARKAKMEEMQLQYGPKPVQDPWRFSLDEKSGKVVAFNQSSGETVTTQYTDPQQAKDELSGNLKQYSDAQAILADPNSTPDQKKAAQMVVDMFNAELKDKQRPPTSLYINPGSGLTNAQESRWNQIISQYNQSPLIRAADSLAVASGITKLIRQDPKNGARQIGTLYSYIKALDPDTAVREGELRLAQQAQSLYQRLDNMISRIQNNQVVDPSMILQVAQETDNLIAESNRAAARKADSFKSQAKTLGLEHKWNEYIGGFRPSYSTEPSQSDVVRWEIGPDGKPRRAQ